MGWLVDRVLESNWKYFSWEKLQKMYLIYNFILLCEVWKIRKYVTNIGLLGMYGNSVEGTKNLFITK